MSLARGKAHVRLRELHDRAERAAGRDERFLPAWIPKVLVHDTQTRRAGALHRVVDVAHDERHVVYALAASGEKVVQEAAIARGRQQLYLAAVRIAQRQPHEALVR